MEKRKLGKRGILDGTDFGNELTLPKGSGHSGNARSHNGEAENGSDLHVDVSEDILLLIESLRAG